MTTRRARATATLLANGNVLIAAGADRDGPDAAIASAEIFNADTLRFQPTGSLHRPRLGQTATLLNDGNVLMAVAAMEASSRPQSYTTLRPEPSAKPVV